MTAASAHDWTVECLRRALRCQRNAARIGNKRMAARFEARALRLQQALNEWRHHPALHCTITPEGDRFVVRRSEGRRVLSRSTLYAAQTAAVEAGFRSIDLSACGWFA